MISVRFGKRLDNNPEIPTDWLAILTGTYAI